MYGDCDSRNTCLGQGSIVCGFFSFSCSCVSNSLWPHGLQQARLPCPSLSPGVCSNSCPLSQWCHPAISSSVIPFSSCLQTFPASESFSNESALHIRWPKYWGFSFSISPFSEYSGLISFRMDWFDLLAVQGTLKSLLQHHSSKASILKHSAFLMVHTRKWKWKWLSHVRLFSTPWTIQSVEFFRPEYWSG